MLKVTVDNKYSAEGSDDVEVILNLPEHILTNVYREADRRICQNEPFASAEFPLEGELEDLYNKAIDDVLVESFDFEMEINNHSVKWEVTN